MKRRLLTKIKCTLFRCRCTKFPPPYKESGMRGYLYNLLQPLDLAADWDPKNRDKFY